MNRAIPTVVFASLFATVAACSAVDITAEIREQVQGGPPHPTSGTGATSGIGGSANFGGSSGTAGDAGYEPSITLQNGLYTSGDYSGYLWTAADSGGSLIDPSCQTGGTCFADTACVSGVVAQIPTLPDGQPDYANTWGAMVGWNLGVSAVDEPAPPSVSVAGKTTISVGLANAPSSDIRILLSVPSAGGEQLFCKNVRLVEGRATVDLTTLRTECWANTGTTFDPNTMMPNRLDLQFVADVLASHFFQNACITALSID